MYFHSMFSIWWFTKYIQTHVYFLLYYSIQLFFFSWQNVRQDERKLKKNINNIRSIQFCRTFNKVKNEMKANHWNTLEYSILEFYFSTSYCVSIRHIQRNELIFYVCLTQYHIGIKEKKPKRKFHFTAMTNFHVFPSVVYYFWLCVSFHTISNKLQSW